MANTPFKMKNSALNMSARTGSSMQSNYSGGSPVQFNFRKLLGIPGKIVKNLKRDIGDIIGIKKLKPMDPNSEMAKRWFPRGFTGSDKTPMNIGPTSTGWTNPNKSKDVKLDDSTSA